MASHDSNKSVLIRHTKYQTRSLPGASVPDPRHRRRIAASNIQLHLRVLGILAARAMRRYISLHPGGSMLHRKVARWMPLVIAAFFVGRAAHAQTGRITGQVTDTAGGRPLGGVEITVVGEGERAQFGVRTDAAGRYTLGAVARGQCAAARPNASATRQKIARSP